MAPLFRRSHHHHGQEASSSPASKHATDAKPEGSPTKSGSRKGKEPLVIVDTSRRHLPPPSDLLHYVTHQAHGHGHEHAGQVSSTTSHPGFHAIPPALSTPVSPLTVAPPPAAAPGASHDIQPHHLAQTQTGRNRSTSTGTTTPGLAGLASEVDPFARDVAHTGSMGRYAPSPPTSSQTLPNSPVRAGKQPSPIGTKARLASSPEDRILRDLYLHRHDPAAPPSAAATHDMAGGTQAEASGSLSRSPSVELSNAPPPPPQKSPRPSEAGLRPARSPRLSRGSRGARMETAEEAAFRRKLRAEKQTTDKRSPSSPSVLAVDDSAVHEEGDGPVSATSLNAGAVLGDFQQSSGFGFATGLDLNGPMDDILDPSAAANRTDGRHGSTSGPAQPNIAPWLSEDASTGTASTSAASSMMMMHDWTAGGTISPGDGRRQSLNHFASVPSMPKMRRTGTVEAVPEYDPLAPPSRGSHAEIFPIPGPSNGPTTPSESSTRDSSRSRHGSGDSAQTLSLSQARRPKGSGPEVPPARHASAAASSSGSGRLGRFGSTSSGAVAMPPPAEKKKGLFGLLKRKNTGASAQGSSDFHPGEHRGSTYSMGSAGSKLSNSTSAGSLGKKRSIPGHIDMPSNNDFYSRQNSLASEGLISPMEEVSEHDIHLDMNLDDMEGIVDTTMSAGQAAIPGAPTSAAHTRPGSQSTTGAGQETFSSLGLQGGLPAAGAVTTVSKDSSGSDGQSGSSMPGRSLVGEADRQGPFSRQDPFSNSPTGSLDNRGPGGTSLVHSLNLSPKHTLPLHNQPRRPSQLRNVKMGSLDSETSSSGDPDSTGHLQPLAPAWINAGPASTTVFNDPFDSAQRPSTAGTVSHSSRPGTASAFGTPAAAFDPTLQVPALAGAAAWAAPESWGVEADEEPEEGGDTSSSSEHDEQWTPQDDDGEEEIDDGDEADDRATEAAPVDRAGMQGSGTARKPPPFGAKSLANRGGKPPSSSGRGRPRTGGARPSTARAGKERPGTSGSVTYNATPYSIRIYRADGGYSVHEFSLMTTTVEIINTLSGAYEAPPGRKVTTSMKLYLRERGQDRLLMPSERPLAIQDRRLRQAGFTETDHLEQLGREDLAILCKFIYQTPALPIMDPEEENAYDSFEFIDMAGKDLQTIPIFLHLHASTIVILNVSKNPMTDIPLDFIQACTSLKELRMTNMALKRVPNSIRASTTLARLDVSSNRINDLESVPLNEISTLLSLKVQNNKLTSIPTYFAQMQSLKYLNISNNKFEAFPKVVCEMANLVDLDVSFNNISELPSDMSNLRSLERLAVFGNELTRFPDSFCELANLRDLDVRRNKLTNLDSVYALPNLTRLQADHNNLVTLDAQIGAKVRSFSVPYNSITRFTLAPYKNMAAVTYSLTHLNLSHGKISVLADEALSGLVNLVELNLNFNQFTRLPTTLDRLTNLEVFSCTENMLNSLPLGFGRMQKLRILNVHNNNLKELPADIWGCSSLESFNVSSNLLGDFPDPPADLAALVGPEAAEAAARKMSIESSVVDKFAAMPVPPAGNSLHKLYLGDNRLTDEIFHVTSQMPNLKVLNLSFNDIYEIPSNTLSNNTQLEALYLSGNKLTSLPSEDLERLQRLRVLHLNGNKLQTLPSELGAIKSLQHLDVGSNVLKYNIANWPYDWNWNWNTSLRYLNLSGNKRLEIKPTAVQDMSHAQAIRKELSDFTALTQLRVLGLMDVTLRIPSLPDENDEKRVRTSFSDVNNMAYGISDMLGSIEHLAMFDLVLPNFRGKDNECIFGMFGRPSPAVPSGKIPKFLQETFANMLASQLERLGPGEAPTEAIRRAFLTSNRKAFEFIVGGVNERKRSDASFLSMNSMFRNWSPSVGSLYRTGASGAVVYVVDKTLYAGNIGSNLIVLSRKGEAELLSKIHDPTEREETARIRRAEAWVSPKGFINDDKDVDVSRSFGFWQHFPALNADPEIRVRQLTEADEFVIIGNKALWSVCSYQTAVDIARTEPNDPMMAAQKLRDFAVSYGADGSVMVMVVNVSDLFFGRGRRTKGAGSGPLPPLGDADGESGWAGGAAAGGKRNLRRRYEEVGDRTLNRLQQEIEPPQGHVAIVFTDIVNSTHLWETNPGMPTSIKIHHNLMRRQLRLDGGYEVKTEGDSFMVSFQTVTAAILWAFNCQILLLQQEWPRELLEAPDGKVVYDSEGNIVQRGLRVRMGVHWGAPQCERDPITRRMDYYGPMVNRSARINASADGGQLMASLDVIKEIDAVREFLDSYDEEVADLPAELKRHIQDIRRVGLEVKEMGERKLKGLEVPEKLFLLYPKVLAGRFEDAPHLAANVEVQDPAAAARERQIDIEELRELSSLTLRLEAVIIAAASESGQQSASPPVSPSSTTVRPGHPADSAMVPSRSRMRVRLPPPMYLGPSIREDMGDEELVLILESLTSRVENALSTLYLKQLGGFTTVLSALEQATRIDPRLIVHALSLMNGRLAQ